ncbi:MAG: phage tail protein [Acinetobacter sp.]
MVQSIIDGQKSGKGSARQPEIAPDSARSVTKLKQVIGLTEGEIKGFSKNDIKLDGTPLSALSSEIICDYRFGTVGQEYIPGVDEVANEIGVGVELRGDLDWVKLITNTDIDHVGVRLRWGPLQTSHSNGDVTGVFIHYTVSIAPVNGSYVEVLDATISDKTSDSYERYHEFKLPPSEDGWMIKVSRLTMGAQSTLVSDKMYVQAYAEIIKSKFTFPYTALIYLEYDARSFANVAKVAVNAKGMIIKVPSNYNPETRQYTGLWNGTFKMAYSNNPAWVYFDIVTQPRYGCGDRIDQSMVDKWSLYRLGQYCDQMVDDGYGGLEPRFTCNVYLQSKERAYDVLNRLTGLFRAFNFWNGSQLIVDADIPQDTSYLYTNANVVDGLFEYAGTAATDLYSAAKVAWDNPANGFNTEYEAVSYEHLIKKLGFKTLELDAWGCTSRGQALRAGRWALLAESDTVTFKVGMDGYLAMPGKIIEIQDEFYAGKSNGGRVISVSSSGFEITLDRPVETIAGDTISFNTLAGTVKKYNIASSNGSVVTLTESVGDTIERMHIWAISSSQLATQKYRILTVKYDGIGEFTISAVEYNASKYEDIDSNITFDEPPTSIINPIAQIAVKNVTISSNEYVYQGLNTVNLEIKWERAENAVEYLVEIKKDDGSWMKLPSTGNNSIILENVYAGYYIAKVTAVSAYELKSLPTYSVKTLVLGKLSAPLAPVNPQTVPIQFGIEFYWDFPQGSADTAISRIVVSYADPTDLADDSGFLIYDKAYSDNKIVIQNLNLHTRVWFKVKLIDKLGFESPYTDWVSGLPSQDFEKILDLISGHISESELDQALTGKIDKIDGLDERIETLATEITTEQQLLSERINGVYIKVEPQYAFDSTKPAFDSTRKAYVYTIESALIAGDQAQSERTSAVLAKMARNDALYKQEIRAAADDASAAISATTTLQTTVGENTASIQSHQESIDGVVARATLQVEANGVVGGVALGNNAGVVDFLIRSNTFAVAPPVGYEGSGKYLMTYRTTPLILPNGTIVPTGLFLNNLVVDYIDASKIYADSLSAISANLGTFTTIAPDGSKTVMSGGLTLIYYPNGQLAGRIGVWG